MKLKPRSLISVDLDGILCQGEWWDKEDGAKPIKKNIELVNKLYHAKHHIIIYTARKEKARYETEYWLKKHGVKYHALVMEKMGADCYWDDKSTRDIREFLNNPVDISI